MVRLNPLLDLVKPYFCSAINVSLNHSDGRSSTWAVKQIHPRRRSGRLAQAPQVKAVLDRRQQRIVIVVFDVKEKWRIRESPRVAKNEWNRLAEIRGAGPCSLRDRDDGR